jgi:hypothetical protein
MRPETGSGNHPESQVDSILDQLHRGTSEQKVLQAAPVMPTDNQGCAVECSSGFKKVGGNSPFIGQQRG